MSESSSGDDSDFEEDEEELSEKGEGEENDNEQSEEEGEDVSGEYEQENIEKERGLSQSEVEEEEEEEEEFIGERVGEMKLGRTELVIERSNTANSEISLLSKDAVDDRHQQRKHLEAKGIQDHDNAVTTIASSVQTSSTNFQGSFSYSCIEFFFVNSFCFFAFLSSCSCYIRNL